MTRTLRRLLNLSADRPCAADPTAAAGSPGARADRLLVDRCLAGEVPAWETLYTRYHAHLCGSIKSLLSAGFQDSNLIDEIAARVWYALVRNDGELLDQFDPCRDSRLATFLRGLARIEILQYFRTEQRCRGQEARAGRPLPTDTALSHAEVDALLNDFTATLTPGEQSFLEEHLLLPPQEAGNVDHDQLSEASIWQRRHRIRSKLLTFFRTDD